MAQKLDNITNTNKHVKVILSKMASATKNQGSRFDRAIAIFKKHGGILRTTQVLRMGIHPSTLYDMRDAGSLEMVSRGAYRLTDAGPLGNPDLVTVATRIPNGVICLISALAFHEITTQIPHEIHVALQRGSEKPRLNHPPIKIYRFSGQAFTDGVERHELDGVSVNIYNMEKTLADCFKFRNKIGLDTAVEAVRFYRERRSVNVDVLMHFAKICRVEKVMRPYLEAIL
jgi:predicted transcriptional regulator of viral defense system